MSVKSCQCESCKSACKHKPGWFKPKEIAPAAKLLNMSVNEFFKTKLMVDWWETNDGQVFTLAPAIKNHNAGSEFPSDPRGECVFFNGGLCDIHSAKPFECAALDCSNTDNHNKNHEDAYKSWVNHQDMISSLLGRKPTASEFGSMAEMLSML